MHLRLVGLAAAPMRLILWCVLSAALWAADIVALDEAMAVQHQVPSGPYTCGRGRLMTEYSDACVQEHAI